MPRISPRRLVLVAVALLALVVGAQPLLRSSSAYAVGPTARQLLDAIGGCDQISDGQFATDDGRPRSVPVCGANGAAFWKADMDIDCDGRRSARCNGDADPWYQDDTAFHRSDGTPLDAASLPYVVIPQNSSSAWHYRDYDIRGGAVVAIIYGDQVEYAVFGDTGPTNIIGEASYAAADALGIDPDPATGGTDAGQQVAYIVFEGSHVSPIESRDAAVTAGEAAARAFVDHNS